VCGLTGFWSLSAAPAQLHGGEAMAAVAQAMAARLAHRGPDDHGVWVDPARGIALAHRRLSILDLSPAGHQPMLSASGRWVIVFNGEIYNHLDLRRELTETGLAPAWRGHSDTETLLAGFDAWGIEPTLRKTIGMLALAVWDRRRLTLTLARDRFGEKPLYYGWQAGTLLFASELKALSAHPAFRAEIDRTALSLLLQHGCIPAPHAIFRGIAKLPPGTTLCIHPDGRAEPPRPYWSAAQAIAGGLANPFRGSTEEAVEALERLLEDAVARQMLSDVPLGAFLSGGIDSSAIVALMQRRASTPVKTFTIGFDDAAYDEAGHARDIARHLDTDHTELYVSPREALDVIPLLPQLYDEPFADPSQIPTFLVARLARSRVAVALSGDGADELLGGYDRYASVARLWRRIGSIPPGLRRLASSSIASLSPGAWDGVVGPLARLLPSAGSWRVSGDRLHRLAALLRSTSATALYEELTLYRKGAGLVVGGDSEVEPPPMPALPPLGLREHMMAVDTLRYLPDDILVKVDRAAMGVSLETRAPYLDHRLFELAWSLPPGCKHRDGETKWVLRQALHRHVPRALVDRPKMGFQLPDTWLQGPLRNWAEDLLDETRLHQEGFLHAAPVRALWAAHLSGQRQRRHHLWSVLMLQAWVREHSAARSHPAAVCERAAPYASEQELSPP
jgi:asparagine synthase (glutamine-hydrolysing)